MARRVSTPDSAGNRGGGGGKNGQHANSANNNNNNTPGSHSQVDHDSVTTEAILARLAKAKEIETSLEVISAEQKAAKRGGGGGKPSPASDERAQSLRLQLCEVLSDVILNDSRVAHDADAVGRLWKNCFYGRINDIRSRVARERARAKKRGAGGGEGGAGGAEASKRMAGDLERQLKQFLKEAIQLYRYIVERYVKELSPLSQSQSSGGSEQEEERERSRLVVASLYRMHIHLGDLYRYSAQHKHAEECYLKSAKLAPGTGNPYNQLAVVAQQSQESMTVKALYYYARSLMAARDPFETSRSNLVRLFEGNRKWLDEHARDDGRAAPSRAIVNGAEERRQWTGKERTAANRKALARVVDLQWAFFRGVSLDGRADGRIDLDALEGKMDALEETLSDLIGRSSLGEGLLCEVMAILAFSALGASNDGKLLAADGFRARRSGDPGWNEGIVMTNQALALSFLLRACAALARDVDATLARRPAGGGPGRVRSLSPLLLGMRFAASLRDGRCGWFHGQPLFPAAGEAADDGEGGLVRNLCGRAHAGFWGAVAGAANRAESLPTTGGRGARGADIADIKDFAQFRGYVPFTSFMDDGDYDDAQNRKEIKYAATEEVVEALSEKKQSGGSKGAEAETLLKLDLLLSIADGNTGEGDYLTRNAETGEREYSAGLGKDEEEEVSEGPSPPDSPVVADDDVDVRDDTENAGAKEEGVAVPMTMWSPAKGMALLTPALLTPAALLAGGVVDDGPPRAASTADAPAANNREATGGSSSAPPVDSVFALMNAPEPSNLDATAPGGVEALLGISLNRRGPERPELSARAPLPPPPGFSIRPPLAALPAALPPAPSAAGFYPAGLGAPAVAPCRASQDDAAPFGFGPTAAMPQAGPGGYPAPGMFETMNPFARAPPPAYNGNFMANNARAPPPAYNGNFMANDARAPPPAYNGNFMANNFLAGSSSSPSLNQSGLLHAARGGGGGGFIPQRPLSGGGLDPTLDFLLGSAVPSAGAFDLLVPQPPAAARNEPEDPSDSIMKFLFEPSGNDAPSRGAADRPLYGAPQTYHGMPPTNNPFAT